MGPDFTPAPQGPYATGQAWPTQLYPGQSSDAPQQARAQAPQQPLGVPGSYRPQHPTPPASPSKPRPGWGMLAIGLIVGLAAGTGLGYVIAPKGGTPTGTPTASGTGMAPEEGKVDTQRTIEDAKKPGPLPGWELRRAREASGSWLWSATYAKEGESYNYIQAQAIKGLNSWDLAWVTPSLQYDGYKCGVTQNGSECIADYADGMVSFKGSKVPPADLAELAKGWFAER